MYPVKIRRRGRSLRKAAGAVSLGCWLWARQPVARAVESTFTGPGNSVWSYAGNWSTGLVPTTGDIADLFTGQLVNYDIAAASAVPLQAVQIAGGNSISPAMLSFESGTQLQVSAGLFVGAANTGMIPGSATSTGPGQILQSAGQVNLSTGSLLAVDPSSSYQLSGSAQLIGYNEQLAGLCTQNNTATNTLGSGGVLTNTGTYNLQGSGQNFPTLSADTINNTGTFNQSNSIIQGTTTGYTSFNNSGWYLYSSGTFAGMFTNNPGATVNLTGASIPFTQGIVNNGQITISGTIASYAGPISGSGSLIFNGSQQVTLTGSGSFSGSTSITSGTLSLAAVTGPALQGNVTVGAAGTLVFGADSQLAIGTLLTVNGGTVNLNSHNESIGSLAMTAGQINQPGGLPLDVVNGLVSIGKGSAGIAGGLRTNGSFNFTLANNSVLSVAGPLTGFATSASTGLILNGSGGTLSIYGNSLLSTIDIKQGILQLAEGGSLGGVNTSTTVEAGGSLSLSGQLFTVGDLLGSGAVALGSGTLYVDSSATGSTFSGTVNGSGSMVKFGLGALTLTGTDSASGSTTINGGIFTVAGGGAIGSSAITSAVGTTINLAGAINGSPVVTASGTVNINASAGTGILIRSLGGLSIGSNSAAGDGQVNVGLAGLHSNRTLLVTSSLTLTGTSNSWSGQLDLANNDMVVSNGNLANLTNEVKSGYNAAGGGNWQGTGITSSAAAADTTHLTALGVIQNNNGSSQPIYGSGAPLGTFDGYSPQVSDVLIKYTYFGDANLDGKVDGSDYSLIDNGFANGLTGWYNGDFNYDGVVDGSDYTLIDNAFNSQGSSLAAIDAAATEALPTAQIAAPTVVPEPAPFGLLGLLPLLRRRKQPCSANRPA